MAAELGNGLPNLRWELLANYPQTGISKVLILPEKTITLDRQIAAAVNQRVGFSLAAFRAEMNRDYQASHDQELDERTYKHLLYDHPILFIQYLQRVLMPVQPGQSADPENIFMTAVFSKLIRAGEIWEEYQLALARIYGDKAILAKDIKPQEAQERQTHRQLLDDLFPESADRYRRTVREDMSVDNTAYMEVLRKVCSPDLKSWAVDFAVRCRLWAKVYFIDTFIHEIEKIPQYPRSNVIICIMRDFSQNLLTVLNEKRPPETAEEKQAQQERLKYKVGFPLGGTGIAPPPGRVPSGPRDRMRKRPHVKIS